MSNFERNYWEDNSKVKKWSSGKGKLRLAWVKWGGRHWIDLRILRREDEGYVHSKEGVRLSVEQVRTMLPILNEMLGDIDDAIEKAEREDDI
mgnify:FL=1